MQTLQTQDPASIGLIRGAFCLFDMQAPTYGRNRNSFYSAFSTICGLVTIAHSIRNDQDGVTLSSGRNHRLFHCLACDGRIVFFSSRIRFRFSSCRRLYRHSTAPNPVLPRKV